MATHLITQERLKALLHYDPDTGVFTRRVDVGRRHKAGSVCGNLLRNGYVRIGIGGHSYKAHRLAWLYVYGAWPQDQIDHLNHNKTDNRIDNLRDVTSAQNQQNRRCVAKNTSGHLGVAWATDMQRWLAGIKVGGKSYHLGYFENLADAVAARKAGERIYHPHRPT
jgi:hypothetical protein